jgi:hypothetical protein
MESNTKEKKSMENMSMDHKDMEKDHYKKLFLMTILSFISMYILMYAMVDKFANVYPNINQFYMAGLMTMPMVIIELTMMGSMYMNKKFNSIIIAASTIGLIAFFVLIRQQGAVTDKQFLKSMIPHHASAILMCNQANLSDPEIKVLCQNILSGQQKEIDQMKAKLEEFKK